MIKNLTKSQYYKQKKIPIVTMCRKLQPQLPARTHLLEPLPRLGTELQKIQAKSSCQNKINLELANALKIIHELQYQLEVMTTNCHNYEEQLFVSRNNVKDLERKISKLQEKCLGLEASMQKTEFNMKVKIQQQKDQWAGVISQYERKIEELNDAYNRLKLDREKQLKNAEKFHQSTINKTNIQLQEIESSAQSDIKKFQRQLQKATQQNIMMRQKLTDLDTCNQEHLRQLRKANNDLAQTNLRLKTDYEHKIVTLVAELDLYKNKNNELFDSLSLLQKRYGKQVQNWAQQKTILNQQQMQSEAALRRSYDQIMKQKDKIMQQLNKKGYQVNDKQKKLLELTDKLKHLQRLITQFDIQKSSLVSNFDRTRKQLVDRMEAQFEMKLNQSIGNVQRQMHQKANELVQQEKRFHQQKLRKQTQKLLEKINILQSQLAQSSHSAKSSHEQSRKLQFTIQQLKVELQYQKNAMREQSQSFKNQNDLQNNQFQHRYKNLHGTHINEMDKLKNDHLMFIDTLKIDFELKIRQIEKIGQQKDEFIKDLQAKLRRLDGDYGTERMGFIGRVQAFEITIGKLKNTNQQLLRIKSELQSRLMIGDNQFRNLQVNLQQENQEKRRISNELKQGENQIRKLKQQLGRRQLDFIQRQKKAQSQVFEMRRKQTVLLNQVEAYKKKARDLESRCDDLLKQMKLEEDSRVNLQRKLSQIDTSSQQRWKIIEGDFALINKKLIQQSQKMEKELKDRITQKENQINQLNKKIDEIQSILIKQRNDYNSSNLTWQNKFMQLEETNKKLIKSSFNMQDLQKDNILKESSINGLKKQLEKLKADLQIKQRQILDLSLKIQQSQSNCESLKSQNFQKINEIKNLTFKINEIQRQFVVFKDKISKEGQQIDRKNYERNQQMRRKQEQIKNLQKILEQQAAKNSKLYEQKRRIEIRIQQIQKQNDEDSTRKKSQKIEAIKRISQLEGIAQQIELNLKQKISKIQFEITIKNQQINDRDTEIKRLLKKIQSLQGNLLSVNEEFKNLKLRYDTEKLSAAEYKSQWQKLKFERSEFQRKVKLMIQKIQRLEKQSQKTQKDIIKIYEESDRRVQIAIQQTKSFYETELQAKNTEIETIKTKQKLSLQQQRQESKKRQAKINQQKQQIYKQVIQKSCKITQITIAYQQLGQVYQQVFKELQIYKKKWNKMFSQFNDNNQQLTQINFKIHDFRTDDKKTKKIVKQTIQVKTDKTQRIMTAAENQTPISQNATQRAQENQNSNRNISAFNHSQTFSGIRSGGNRVLTTIMSNSGVINSNQASSEMSVRLDSSSISSKLSNKNE